MSHPNLTLEASRATQLLNLAESASFSCASLFQSSEDYDRAIIAERLRRTRNEKRKKQTKSLELV